MTGKILILAAAVSCAAALAQETRTNDQMRARLLLANGREYICTVLGCEGGQVKIKRTLSGGAVATETHSPDKIRGLYFPKPAFLAETQDVSTAALLESAIAGAKEEYNRWKPFASVKGNNWAAPVGRRYAELLEKARDFGRALEVYIELARDRLDTRADSETALRRAVCTYQLGMISNAFSLFTNALAVADNDSERAEAIYYIGRIEAQFGDYVGSLFTLLKNVVFYSAQGEWEARSLEAALYDYAKLRRSEEYANTCDRLILRFPDTRYAQYAEQCLEKLNAGTSMEELSQFTPSNQESNP